MNGGFFIIGGADGVVGDSAGVIVEHGRSGGHVAAPLAKEIFEAVASRGETL